MVRTQRVRRLLVAASGSISVALVVMSMASACTVVAGSTFYSDGTRSKSGVAGGYASPPRLSPAVPVIGDEFWAYLAGEQVVIGEQYEMRMIDKRQIELGIPPCALWPLVGVGHDGGTARGQVTANGQSKEIPQSLGRVPAEFVAGAGRLAWRSTVGACIEMVIDIVKRLTTTDDDRCEGPFTGGLYGRMKSVVPVYQKGCEIHHMPSVAAGLGAIPPDPYWSEHCAPAIVMTKEDHKATESHGSNPNRVNFQRSEKNLIGAGNLRGAFELNAEDVAAGPNFWRYLAAIAEARKAMEDEMYGTNDAKPCSTSAPKEPDRVMIAAGGTIIRAYAVAAVQGVPYTMVLGNDGGDPGHMTHACMAAVDVLNNSRVFAGPSGLIGTVIGQVHAGTPIGTYQLCFKDSSPNNSTGTGGATFTVL